MKKTFTLLLLAFTVESMMAGDPLITSNPPLANQVGCLLLGGADLRQHTQRGNMFDLTAINQVTITSFDADPAGTTNYEIYYYVGSYVGHESSSAGWTLVGTATNVASQPTFPTPIPITVNVTINAGQTYGWYITSTIIGVSLYNTTGAGVGTLFNHDANLQFVEGCSIDYPFDIPFPARIFNGNVHYCPGALGVDETILPAANAKVYPNPLTNSSTIVIGQNIQVENARLDVYNSLGQEVIVKEEITGNQIILERNNLPAGLFQFTLSDQHHFIASGKFMVE